MGIARRTTGVARHLFVLNQGTLQIGRGVRTAFALLVPVVAADLLVQPFFAWAALGGWLGSLADKGGAYRTRAMTMGALAIVGSLCALAGTDAASSASTAVVSMLVVGILGGLGRVYGDEGATVGLFIAVIYAVAAGSPSPAAHAEFLRGGMFAGGVVWAMVLSLLLWPLHPFRRARRAVAASYRTLAEFSRALEVVARAIGDASAAPARARASALHGDVRSALENARIVLADARRPKQGRSPRGEQLLVLTEGAEQLFGTMVAIDAELDAVHESGSTASEESFAKAFGCLAKTFDLLDTAIDDSLDARRRAPVEPPALGDLTVRTDSPNVHLRAAATLLSRLSNDVDVLVDTAARIDSRASSVVPTTAEHRAALPPIARDHLAWLAPLREAFTPRSLPARHAFRMGIAAAAAVWLSFALDITRGYWATITTLIVLQPYSGATMRKSLQRVAGSVVGGIIAAGLAVVARTKLAIAGVMVPFTIASVAVLPLNYGVFVLLLTPVFVLLAEPHPGDWGIAGLRVVNTLLGGAIALAASQLLWPSHEIATYASQLATLVRELRAQLVLVTGANDSPSFDWRARANEVRRPFGIAVTNAEATIQRLITEDAPKPHRVESAMSVLAYGRRMASTMSAMAESRASGDGAPPAESVEPLLEKLDALISALDHSSPAALEESGAGALGVSRELANAGEQGAATHTLATQTIQSAQLERIGAQLAVMRRAVARYVTA
ncbi:MAG: FUSC family protein [Gemmatimonadaceae bacterium]|nr:FUSC family protein [Gemmatimonadaceae bacterium]